VKKKKKIKKEDQLLYDAVKYSLEIGYRHIDSAQAYDTERILKNAIDDSGVKREDIFITSKLVSGVRDPQEAAKSIDKSLKLLGTEYIDLFLMHSPTTFKKGADAGKDVIECYKVFVEYQKQGKIRSIGVSNFNIDHLRAFESHGFPLPSVNQIEVHPFLVEEKLIDYCNKKNIKIEAYSPIAQAKKLDDPVLKKLAAKYKKNTAQIMLRWGLQMGFIILPKSSDLKRIKDNANLFDFELSAQDMKELDALKKANFRCCWNVINTAKWGNVVPKL